MTYKIAQIVDKNNAAQQKAKY